MQCSLEARAPHQTDSAPAPRWLCDLSPKCTWHFQAETLPSDQASSCVAWSSGNKTKKQWLHKEDTSQAEINWFWRRTQGGRWSILCSDEVGELQDHYRQDLGVWITTTRFHRQDRGKQRSPHVSVFRIFRTFPYTERVHFNIVCFEVRGHCANHIWPPFKSTLSPVEFKILCHHCHPLLLVDGRDSHNGS